MSELIIPKKGNIETVRVILPIHEDILVIRRNKNSKTNPGLWELPGGQTDPDETLEKCAIREALQETGFTIKIGSLTLLQTRMVDDATMYGQYSAWGGEARIIGGEFRRGNEHDGEAFVNPLQLPPYDFTTVSTIAIGLHNRHILGI